MKQQKTFQEEVLEYISKNEHSTCVIASVFGLGCKSMRRFLIRWKKERLVRMTRRGLWVRVITKE